MPIYDHLDTKELLS